MRDNLDSIGKAALLRRKQGLRQGITVSGGILQHRAGHHHAGQVIAIAKIGQNTLRLEHRGLPGVGIADDVKKRHGGKRDIAAPQL